MTCRGCEFPFLYSHECIGEGIPQVFVPTFVLKWLRLGFQPSPYAVMDSFVLQEVDALLK